MILQLKLHIFREVQNYFVINLSGKIYRVIDRIGPTHNGLIIHFRPIRKYIKLNDFYYQSFFISK